ncbi:hypothetical protein MPSEU_000867800 [Mayamaea pseudoterrestris]|nr:hypothetical protein MPSEU_000867800 [Mayamaea pseudoterrestris]
MAIYTAVSAVERTLVLVLGFFACTLRTTTAQIIHHHDVRPANFDWLSIWSTYYVRGPGAVDLSGITFVMKDSKAFSTYFPKRRHGMYANDDSNRDVVDASDHEDETRSGPSVIEIVVFDLSTSYTQYSKSAFQWMDNFPLQCCTAKAAAANECQLGELAVISDKDPFIKGMRRMSVPLSSSGVTVVGPLGVFDKPDSGFVSIHMAKCDRNKQTIGVTGNVVIRHVHGYLPGEFWNIYMVFAAIFIGYCVTFAWYGAMMYLHRATRVPMEKYVWMTILLGLLEAACWMCFLVTWNTVGSHPNWLLHVCAMVGGVKQVWCRSLMVMLSLGWHVTRIRLGRKTKWIVFLGMLFLGILMIQFLYRLGVWKEPYHYLRYGSMHFAMDTLLDFLIATIDLVYIAWILFSLSSSMTHLRDTSRTRKLKKYSTLRMCLVFFFLSAPAWGFETFIKRLIEPWTLFSASQMNYLLIILAVACLWRPSASAMEYSYVPSPVVEIEVSDVLEVPEASDASEQIRRRQVV